MDSDSKSLPLAESTRSFSPKNDIPEGFYEASVLLVIILIGIVVLLIMRVSSET
jgi:hypothetical protein